MFPVVDLNKGAGGAYIYLCVRYTATPVFQGIYAVWGDTATVACHSAQDWMVPGNLNQGTRGKSIYFCMTPYANAGQLRSVRFVTIGGVASATAYYFADSACWDGHLDSTDLNKGAGGDYIYTCWANYQ